MFNVSCVFKIFTECVGSDQFSVLLLIAVQMFLSSMMTLHTVFTIAGLKCLFSGLSGKDEICCETEVFVFLVHCFVC